MKYNPYVWHYTLYASDHEFKTDGFMSYGNFLQKQIHNRHNAAYYETRCLLGSSLDYTLWSLGFSLPELKSIWGLHIFKFEFNQIL